MQKENISAEDFALKLDEVVVSQPSLDKPIPISAPPNILQPLVTLEKIIVKQEAEAISLKSGCIKKNKYTITDPISGQSLFLAGEGDNCCMTNFYWGSLRPFEIKISDVLNKDQEVIHLLRPLRCSICCFPCCLQNVEIRAPPGNVIGSIKQNWSFCIPNFSVLNEAGEIVLNIKADKRSQLEIVYKVMTLEDKEIGRISRKLSTGCCMEIVPADAEISFPLDLDVKMKTLVLGSYFLIDFMMFQTHNDVPTSLFGLVLLVICLLLIFL